MTILRLCLLVLVVVPAATGRAAEDRAPQKITIDFEKPPVERVPEGFRTDLTGEGAACAWSISEDDTAPSGKKVVTQTSADRASNRFPLLINEALRARDVAISVKLRPVSGKVDQAGGIVWRYHDRGNYYVVRANALEDNVVLYKVQSGKRTDLKPVDAGWLAYGKKVEVPKGRWTELRVESNGSRHSVFLDGRHLFDVEDETFLEAGKIGLWTKADSVTRFDDLTIEIRDTKTE